jgi:hypothetical protein
MTALDRPPPPRTRTRRSVVLVATLVFALSAGAIGSIATRSHGPTRQSQHQSHQRPADRAIHSGSRRLQTGRSQISAGSVESPRVAPAEAVVFSARSLTPSLSVSAGRSIDASRAPPTGVSHALAG